MKRQLNSLVPREAKIAVVRALHGIGDLLCLVPALRALRAHFPSAEVVLIAPAGARSIVERFDKYIDRLLPLPGYPALLEPVDVAAAHRFIGGAQRERFDLALQMHGSGVASNAFTLMLGARVTAGFYLPSVVACPVGEWFVPYRDDLHEIERHLYLLASLGVPSAGNELEWPLLEEDHRELSDALPGLPGNYAVVHPGAVDPKRRWGREGFEAVARALRHSGLDVVVTGKSDEHELCDRVARAGDGLNAAGRTSLAALGPLLASARLLVTNDTATSHLAAALRTRSVVIFCASEPSRWAPLDVSLHAVVGRGIVHSHPCSSVVDVASACLRDGCTLPSRTDNTIYTRPPIDDVLGAIDRALGMER